MVVSETNSEKFLPRSAFELRFRIWVDTDALVIFLKA